MSALPAKPFADLPQQHYAGRLGLWLFLANEILFFGGFFCAYGYMRAMHGPAFAAASRRTDLLLGSVESAVLLLSGLTVMAALRDIRAGLARRAAIMLWTTAALGLLFLVLHGAEYHDEFKEHLLPGPGFVFEGPRAQAEAFFFLYYLMTGCHGLHVAVGVALFAVYARQTGRGRYSAGHHPQIELAGLYWHLVELVWVFLFPAMYLVNRA